MSDHSKSSAAPERHCRVRSAYNWSKPILWGMGIGVLVGGVMVAVIFLDRIGLLPRWVFGWISNERETQKRQVLRILFGLGAFWFTTRLVKFGLVGEIARTTYNGIVAKFHSFRNETNREIHARICAVRNVRSALILSVFFTYEVFLAWRALGKPFPEHNLYDLLFIIVMWAVLLPSLLKICECVPERFILGIVTIRLVIGWVIEFAPNLIEPVADAVRQCALVLSVLAFLTSVGMLVSSLSNSNLRST